MTGKKRAEARFFLCTCKYPAESGKIKIGIVHLRTEK